MMVARRTPGPAYANLQWRKPREVCRGCASDAMGIWTRAVCWRGALTTSAGSGRRGGELGRSIAITGTGVAQWRLIDKSVAPGVATASMVMADRESARQRRNGMPRRTDSGHDVSILITARPVARRGAALEYLDDDHATAAARTRVLGRLGLVGIGAVGIRGLGLFRGHVEQAARLGDVGGAGAAGEQAVVADAVEACGRTWIRNLRMNSAVASVMTFGGRGLGR